MSKDIRGYFSSSSKSSSVAVAGSKDISSSDSEDSDIEPITKKPCHSSSKIHPTSTSSKKRHYLKRWETEFEWLEYDEDLQGAFCKFCKKWAKASNKTGGTWVTKPFNNWKKAVAKMKEHAESEGHVHACQIETSSATALLRGSIAQRLQQVQESERLKNRAAIKSLLRCTHFLAHQHIAHTTNFSELVDLVVSCGGEDLRHFLEKAGKNATYTSKDAVVDFVETIGLWVEECLLKRLRQAQYFSLLADECTDISTIEELSVVIRWVEDGLPVEHFIELVPLKKADANAIYENLIDCLKKKGLMVSNIIGMGFDGAATFSGKHNGVQALLNRNSPHSIFVHCHCHLLQLACVQAANSTQGIKHVYTTLTTLWKYFHYSPKRAECLREIQRVLDMSEFKIIKPSDTRWLAHERCVKVVKENYCTIVNALNNIYEETHEPEALGISKALSKKSTISAMFLLDYVLPQIAKLSKTLQTEKLDITIISCRGNITYY